MIPNKKNVIDLWRASEMLTVPEIPTANGKDLFYATKYGRLPWEDPKLRKARAEHTLFYVVYLGVVGKAEAHARMATAFGASVKEDEYREAREFDAECFSAVLFLDAGGAPLEQNAFQLADYTLGYAQKQVPQFQGERISKLRKALCKEFEARFATPVEADPVMEVPVPVSQPETLRVDASAFNTISHVERLKKTEYSDTKGVPFDWDRIDREERYLRHLAPYLFDPWNERVLVRRVEVKEAEQARNSYGLMPNFYMDDLEWIGDLEPNANHGALEHILNGSIDDGCLERVDLLKPEGASALNKLLSVTKMPPARWPSNPAHHLMMGQQAAVNSIWELSKIDGTGLRAVNGPPGTGKTTLLRDVIANIITERAFTMAKAANSSDLFEIHKTKKLELMLPVAALGDSGIVVTSNNNSAVENISAELPEAGAIDKTFQAADFLPLSGTAILNARNKKDTPTLDAWGAIAAALGNKANRSAFEKAWHPELAGTKGLPPLGRDLEDTEGKASFQEAKKRLFDCRRRVTKFQSQLAEVEYVPNAPVPEGVDIPSEALLQQPEDRRQLMSFNVNEDFEIARSELFLAALDLHRAALSENYASLKETLTLCNTMVGSGLLRKDGLSADEQRRLWDLVFLCVPVISTSLASVKRMFDQFQGGQIPWLLIDEAGQATPSSAAGALWRAKRAVIVGDPLQVEPVATFEDESVNAIAEALKVGDDLSPAGNSVQAMADRAMSVGAYIGTGSNAVWGGLPLRAHRRCADPMFRVANKIAYGGQMVQANKNGSELEFPLGESCWIDVASPPSEGHVNKSEIDFVKQVRKWIAAEQKASRETLSVFFISPFKKVAAACGGANIEGVDAGSVHAFQGKEADVVFVVLGSATGKKGAGSRSWAGKAPNILNVALTRAKKRVYIVGSITDWGSVPNFSTLADDMKSCDQVIGLDEALKRFGMGLEDPIPDQLANIDEVSPEADQEEVTNEATNTAREANLNWRSIAEIWEEKRGEPGFRVVRKNWKDPYTGSQYTLLTEGQLTSSEVSFAGSYTQIQDGYETRGPAKKIGNHADASWVTLEEALNAL